MPPRNLIFSFVTLWIWLGLVIVICDALIMTARYAGGHMSGADAINRFIVETQSFVLFSWPIAGIISGAIISSALLFIIHNRRRSRASAAERVLTIDDLISAANQKGEIQ